jgi:hypothetical protein
VGKRAEWTDAAVVADLTRELPLARYCLIGGRLYTWGRLRQPGGDAWVPLWLLIKDNALAAAAPGAMCRAGARAFRSAEEAVAWGRAHPAALADAALGTSERVAE